MRTIIAGSRTITSYQTVCECIKDSGFTITEVVSGAARGVDKLGEMWAKENKVAIKQFPADWDKFGRKAGHIRNEEMAQYATCLIAIWDGESPGTGSMIHYAIKYGLKMSVFVRKAKDERK